MKTRELGKSGLQVSTIGFGCMGISFSYATKLSKDKGMGLIRAAVDRGVIFFDTAEVYGPFTNRRRRRSLASGPRQGRHRHRVRLRH
jgi:aryl-alcohol dehydrogenase-like predicted oxidoreductase